MSNHASDADLKKAHGDNVFLVKPEQIFSDDSNKIIVITSPSSEHLNDVRRLKSNGLKVVLVEKPIAQNSKQGSDGTVSIDSNEKHRLDMTMEQCKIIYNSLIGKGIAPEQARMVLPQSMMTEWIWSGTLYAFARVCNLRCAKDTQEETRHIANQIHNICNKEFPNSWKYLKNEM